MSSHSPPHFISHIRKSKNAVQKRCLCFVVSVFLLFQWIFLCAFYRVSHSKNAIVKPPSKSSDKDRKDVDKAMRRVKEASSIIEDEIDPGMCYQVSFF